MYLGVPIPPKLTAHEGFMWFLFYKTFVGTVTTHEFETEKMGCCPTVKIYLFQNGILEDINTHCACKKGLCKCCA